MTNVVDFLLNRSAPGGGEANPVTSPAFSLTKVLSTAAVVLTPLTTLLVKEVGDLSFSGWQIVSLIIAVLGFLAITASADVLARARVSKREIVPFSPYSEFDPPLTAVLAKPGPDVTVDVIGSRSAGGTSQLLVKESGQGAKWVKQSELTFPKG